MRESLGHYKIIRQVGSGGMGEVYAAEDPTLNRQVALKVLPEAMASQPERVARFEREAKAVAALDHPNIVTIHSVEEDQGVHFITMQLVEGQTLSEQIPKKGFSLQKLFDLAIPMADAISAAHDHGVTHRDLKPTNVMVTDDGRVKVLDFGLAKLKDEVAAEAPTLDPDKPLTEEGKIVGTVAYMSPEQAEGKTVDHRSDIFSLGIILYEMATGERPFKGDTKVSLMSSIVKDTPTSITELNTALPRHLGRIVRRCLAKDVGHRYQTATDVRNELEELKGEIDSGDMIAPVLQVRGRRWVWPAVSGALVAALLLILLVPGLVFGGSSGDILAASPRRLTNMAGNQYEPSLKPGEDYFVYADNTEGNWDIVLQRFEGNPFNLTKDHPQGDDWDYQATYDPTGGWIAFRARREPAGIWVMEATGERPGLVVEGGFHPAWSPDGTKIVYTNANVGNAYGRNWGVAFGQIHIVDVETGDTTPVYTDAEIDAFHPSWSPDGGRIAFAGLIGSRRDIWTISTDGEDLVPVTEDPYTDWWPFWSPDGDYLYFLSDRGEQGKPDLWRVRMDPTSGEKLDEPEEVWSPEIGRIIQASISGDRIICTVERVDSRIDMIPVDPETAEPLARPQVVYYGGNEWLTALSVSPDDRYLGFVVTRGREDVFVVPPEPNANGKEINLTKDAHLDRAPVWYPIYDDRLWLTFQSNRVGGVHQIFAVQPDRPGSLQQITDFENGTGQPRWHPEGNELYLNYNAIRGGGAGNDRRVWQFPGGLLGDHFGPGQTRRVLENASWSPNGELYAQGAGTALGVRSDDPRVGINHGVVGYRARGQVGNRWFDDDRFLFKDLDLRKVFLWDVRTQTAAPIESLDAEPIHYVFSKDRETLFTLSRTVSTEIWLLELAK